MTRNSAPEHRSARARIRVLLLNYEYPPSGGGAGRATWHLCRELPSFGVGVDAIVSRGLDAAEEALPGARIFTVPTHRKSSHETGALAMIEYLWRARPLARRLLSEGHHDFVHYFFSVPTGLLSFALDRGRPYVVSLRGGDVPGFNPGEFALAHALLAPFNRLILERAAKVVALGDELKRHTATRWRIDGIEVIRNGVDSELFRPDISEKSSAERTRLLYVGRFVAWKGLDDLLAAMTLLPKRFELDLVGTGAEEAALRRRCEAFGLSGRVRFLGALPHESLPAIYRSADMFVIPSLAESFSQVTAEALASGLPVVAAKAGALPNLIDHGQNGLLVEPRNARAIAEAVLAISGDADLRRRMAEAARRKAVETLSWSSVARAYAEIYGRCLAEAQARTKASSSGGSASTM